MRTIRDATDYGIQRCQGCKRRFMPDRPGRTLCLECFRARAPHRRRKVRHSRRGPTTYREIATANGTCRYVDSDWTDAEWSAITAAMRRKVDL